MQEIWAKFVQAEGVLGCIQFAQVVQVQRVLSRVQEIWADFVQAATNKFGCFQNGRLEKQLFASAAISLIIQLILLTGLAAPQSSVYAAEVSPASEQVPDQISVITAPPSTLGPARQLAHEAIAALGGMDRVKAMFDSMSLAKGKMTDFSAMSGAANTVEIAVLSQRDKFKIDLQILGQKAVTGYNGKTAWQQHGDEVFPCDPITSKSIADDTSHGALLLLKLEDPGIGLKVVADKVVQGRVCAGLEVITEDGKPTTLYIDRGNHMIAGIEYMGMDFEQGSDAPKRSEFSDYRPFLGSLMAFKSVEYTSGKKTSEQLLTSVEIENGVDDTVFNMPARKPIQGLSKGPVVIPFEYLSNEVIIKAKVNDRMELRFLLDTGATQNVMERTAATTFGTITKSDMALTTGSGFVTMGGLVLRSLQFGEIKLTDVPMAVADMPGFGQIKGGRPAGIIGANVLRRFAVTIDYEQRKVTFRDPDSLIVPEGAAVVQAQPALGSVGLSVDGLANGKLKLRLLVDTGAAFNSISEPLLKPVLDFPLLPVGSVEGVDGYKVEVGAVQLHSLEVNNMMVESPVFSVAPDPASSKLPAGLLSASALGILGNTYWSHFKLTVDYLNGRIILEQSSTSKLTQSILSEAHKTFARYLRDHNTSAAIASYDQLLAKSQTPELIRVRALVALDKAKIVAEKSTARAFETPYVIAKESNDNQIVAKVLADQCLFVLDHQPGSTDMQNARQLLQMASGLSESEPDLLVAAGVYFARLGPLASTRKMIDQALVQDPVNWRGLVERYQMAKRENKPADEHQLLEVIHHYYPGCTPLEEEVHARSE